MRAVNLLPRELDRRRKAPTLPVVVACGVSVVAAAVLAVGYLQASSSVGRQSTALAAAQAELAANPPPAPPPATVTSLPAERQGRTAVLASALGQRVAWDRILREVSLILPDDVWLTGLDASAPTGGTAANTDNFHISGYTYSEVSVARLLARLSVIPDLTGIVLHSASTTSVGGRDIVSFDIGGGVRLTGVTS